MNRTEKNAPHTHVIVGDTQIGPGTPIDHLPWIGRYISEKYANKPNTTVMQLGDWYDLHGLSWYDRGKKSGEGSRVREDIQAGNDADELFVDTIKQDGVHSTLKLVKLRGNHEDRLDRYYNDHPFLDESLPELEDVHRWDEVHGFKEVVWIDGVAYSHYFYQQNSGRPYAGSNVETRLKTIGASFTQGHQQGLLIGTRSVLGRAQWGLVLGSTYLHREVYRGPQANDEFRGIVVCHNVKDGAYDPKVVSLDSLCMRYEGKPLSEYMKRRKK